MTLVTFKYGMCCTQSLFFSQHFFFHDAMTSNMHLNMIFLEINGWNKSQNYDLDPMKRSEKVEKHDCDHFTCIIEWATRIRHFKLSRRRARTKKNACKWIYSSRFFFFFQCNIFMSLRWFFFMCKWLHRYLCCSPVLHSSSIMIRDHSA